MLAAAPTRPKPTFPPEVSRKGFGTNDEMEVSLSLLVFCILSGRLCWHLRGDLHGHLDISGRVGQLGKGICKRRCRPVTSCEGGRVGGSSHSNNGSGPTGAPSFPPFGLHSFCLNSLGSVFSGAGMGSQELQNQGLSLLEEGDCEVGTKYWGARERRPDERMETDDGRIW